MIVIKIGGAEGIDYDVFLEDLSRYKNFVLVQGGSYETNILSKKLGKPPKFLKSASGFTSRYTDKETLEIFTMAYAGKMNKMVVEKLQKLGVNAVGLSGIDGRLMTGKRNSAIKIIENGKKKIVRDDYTGKVEKINVALLKLFLDNGYMPVITAPALSYENESINVDLDPAAAAIAAQLKAEILIIFSNVPGLLKNKDDKTTLIKKINKEEIDNFMQYAIDRMKKKVLGAKMALEAGVKKVIFADARIKKPVTEALNGKGTVIE